MSGSRRTFAGSKRHPRQQLHRRRPVSDEPSSGRSPVWATRIRWQLCVSNEPLWGRSLQYADQTAGKTGYRRTLTGSKSGRLRVPWSAHRCFRRTIVGSKPESPADLGRLPARSRRTLSGSKLVPRAPDLALLGAVSDEPSWGRSAFFGTVGLVRLLVPDEPSRGRSVPEVRLSFDGEQVTDEPKRGRSVSMPHRFA